MSAEDGKPVGGVYVGETYMEDGENRDVAFMVDSVPEPGEMFNVMLHRDVNENQGFDSVFVDERGVLDKVGFDGTKMIAHPFAAPMVGLRAGRGQRHGGRPRDGVWTHSRA